MITRGGRGRRRELGDQPLEGVDELVVDGRGDLDRSEMVRTGSFSALWATYTIGCLAGLMAIGFMSFSGIQL